MEKSEEPAQSSALGRNIFSPMLTEQLTKLEETLIAGCEAHLSSGGHIISGGCFDNEKGYCPVWSSINREEAAALKTSSLISKMHFGLVKALGFKISEMDMLGFVNGFDGMPNS